MTTYYAVIGQLVELSIPFDLPSWIPCDGQELYINDYQKLYNVIGDSWGKSSAPGYFKLPNFPARELLPGQWYKTFIKAE